MSAASVNLAFATKDEDFGHCATVIASALRRTARMLRVKIFHPDPPVESIRSPRLHVDFLRGGVAESGGIDWLALLHGNADWRRCIVLGVDCIVLCDIAEWFDTDLKGSAIAGFSTPVCLRNRLDERRGPPAVFDAALDQPVLRTAFLADLSLLRRQVPRDRMKKAVDYFGMKGTAALSAAAAGRICLAEDKWGFDSLRLRKGEFPECVLHWSGSEKPWLPFSKASGKDAWLAEKCSWEALRMGEWTKPVAIEIQPSSLASTLGLAKRGWKVHVYCGNPDHEEATARVDHNGEKILPDLEVVQGPSSFVREAEMVRFGSGAADIGVAGALTGAARFLREHQWRPPCVVLCGPVGAGETRALAEFGYHLGARVRRADFSQGGADPSCIAPSALGSTAGEESLDQEDQGFDWYLFSDPSLGGGRDDGWRGPSPDSVSRVSTGAADGSSGWEPIMLPLVNGWRDAMRRDRLPGAEAKSINLVFSADENALSHYAALLHSVVRRTNHPVHTRCYCRGFLPESFHVRNLAVEFIEVTDDRGGAYPWWSNSCAFDRLNVLRDHPAHWDRCWIMDHDQIAIADLGRIFFDDFEGAMVMSCDYGYKLKDVIDVPPEIGEVADHSFYLMGPILNLSRARKEGIWAKLVYYHRIIASDEQKALVAATGGELKVLHKRWNRIVYQGDPDADYVKLFPRVKRPESDYFENYGILHFTGGPKPWWDPAVEEAPKKKERVWFKEYATWEKLRAGDWATPEGCELVVPR